jgi:hypothetical protein
MPSPRPLIATLLTLAAALGAPAGAAATPASGMLDHAALGVLMAGAPSIAATGAGDLYVGYSGRPSPGTSTYTAHLAIRRRPTTDASPLRWKTLTVGGVGGATSEAPQAATLSSGGAAVVWPATTGLYLTFADTTSTDQSIAASTRQLTAHAVSGFAVAVDGTDKTYVAWTDDPSHPVVQHLAIVDIAGNLIGPITVSGDALPLEPPRLAVDPKGGGVIAWSASLGDPLAPTIRAQMFTPTGLVGPLLQLGNGSGVAAATRFADDRAIITWRDGPVVNAALVTATGTISNTQQLTTVAASGSAPPVAAVNSSGELIVGYDKTVPAGTQAVTRLYRPAAITANPEVGVGLAIPNHIVALKAPGSWGAQPILTDASGVPWTSQPCCDYFLAPFPVPLTGARGTIASASDGSDLFAAFANANGDVSDVVVSSIDSTDPTVDVATVPRNTVAGTAITVTAVASDAASPVTITWSFGDGSAPVSATTAQHTYAQPGLYAVTTTATDAAGNVSRKIQYVTVAAAPPGDGGTGTTPATTTTTPTKTTTATTPGPSSGAGVTDRRPATIAAFKIAMLARGRSVVGLLGISVQRGARLSVICRAGCGRTGASLGAARATRRAPRPRIRFHAKVGAVLEARATATGRTGRYARFRILARTPFAQRLAEGCLTAAGRATAC